MMSLTINECAKWLGSRDRFLIISHSRPDGDALGSSAGLCQGLRDNGKIAYTLFNPEATGRYKEYTEPYIAPEDYKADYIIAVDLADTGIIQVNAKKYEAAVDLCIDHHMSNKHYARSELLLSDRASCGEIIFYVLRELEASISPFTAKALYMALATDTGCFRYKNTTAVTHRAAADLIEAGAPSGDLNRDFFMLKTRSRLLLEALMLQSLEFFMDGEAVMAVVTLDMMNRAGVTEEDMDDIAVISGQIRGTETSITLRQINDAKWKVSVRTGVYANANLICAEFGGGGHGMAAGGSIEGDINTAKEIIKAAVKKHWKSQ